MALTKKLQKIGGTSLGLIINQEVLKLLNVDLDAEEVKVSLEVYGDALVVRREDAPKLNVQQVGQLFGLAPWDVASLPQRLDFSDILPAIREVLEVLETAGPSNAAEIAEKLNLKFHAAANRLQRAERYNYVLKEGTRYALNMDRFD